jgi:hypothetical protein
MIYLISGYARSSQQLGYDIGISETTQWIVRAFDDLEIAKGFARELMGWFDDNVEPINIPNGIVGTLEKVNPMDPIGTTLDTHLVNAWNTALLEDDLARERDLPAIALEPTGWWSGLSEFTYGVEPLAYEYSEPLQVEDVGKDYWEISWVVDGMHTQVMDSD